MLLLDQIAEARIAEAMRNGAFEKLPGAGKPVVLDEDHYVPESLRVAYRILKNSGFLPNEVCVRREINDVRVLLAQCDDSERPHLSAKLSYLLVKLGQERRSDIPVNVEPTYLAKLVKRFPQSASSD